MKKISILILTLAIAAGASAMIAPPPAPPTTTAKYNVTLTTKGNGKGYFSTSPSMGLAIGKTVKIDKNTEFTITAVAYEGSKFASWGGDCANTTGTVCKIKVDGKKNIIANFATEVKVVNKTDLSNADATCAKNAIAAKDTAVIAAYQTYTTKWIASINARTAAQKLAFDKTGAERVTAMKAATTASKAIQRPILKELTDTKGRIISLYRLEMKKCGYEDNTSDE